MASSIFIWPGLFTYNGSSIVVQAPIVLPAGGGTATYTPSGALTVNTTQAGTPASTAETDLWTYSLPANTLNANNKGVRITVFGTTAANGNAKTVRLYFGGTVIGDRGTSIFGTGGSWRYESEVIRTGASAQLAVGAAVYNGATQGVDVTTPAGDTTGAIVIKVSGQNGTAVANDIVFRGAVVEVIG